MKTRPLGFTQENVKATHDGIKTMTRRVMNPQPFSLLYRTGWQPKGTQSEIYWPDGSDVNETSISDFCPYGQVGEGFWLKETWGICSYSQQFEDKLLLQIAYKAGKAKMSLHPDCMTHDLEWRTVDLETWHKYTDGFNFKWRSGRFMPKFASRTDLELVSVRVEQLQDISVMDMYAEGINDNTRPFKPLWDSINGKKHPWASNPWAWVLGYKLVEREAGL